MCAIHQIYILNDCAPLIFTPSTRNDVHHDGLTLAPVELDGSSNRAQILGFVRCQQVSSPFRRASSKPNIRAMASSEGCSSSSSSLSRIARVLWKRWWRRENGLYYGVGVENCVIIKRFEQTTKTTEGMKFCSDARATFPEPLSFIFVTGKHSGKFDGAVSFCVLLQFATSLPNFS